MFNTKRMAEIQQTLHQIGLMANSISNIYISSDERKLLRKSAALLEREFIDLASLGLKESVEQLQKDPVVAVSTAPEIAEIQHVEEMGPLTKKEPAVRKISKKEKK